MRRNRWFAVFVVLLATPCAFIYVGFAFYSVQAIVFPDLDVAFGPHTMPLDLAAFLVIRAFFGVLLVASSLMVIARRERWARVIFPSLVVIFFHNVYGLVHAAPNAAMTGSSVLHLFPPLVLIEYVLHFVALIASIFLLGYTDRFPRAAEQLGQDH